MTTHSYYVEPDPRTRKVRAVCSCGWRSPWFSTGGLAGAAFDTHVAETAVPTVSDRLYVYAERIAAAVQPESGDLYLEARGVYYADLDENGANPFVDQAWREVLDAAATALPGERPVLPLVVLR